MAKIQKQPVVVLVGHIDHGKSSILEAIWDLKITEKEAGGITQHIGAYEIEHQGQKITFLDTPGHEAFSAMRERGAKVADVGVLVVAADESVKPQTKEAIEHLRKAGIPFVVAINKIDKGTANPFKVKQDLAKEGVFVEELGGDVPCVEVSAKTGQGIKDLVELLLLVAQLQDLEVEKDVPAKGVIIETVLDPKKGPLATLLVEEGILHQGDIIYSYTTFAKARRIENFLGKEMKEVLPGQSCQIMGWENLPIIGERFEVLSSLTEAREKAEQDLEKIKEEKRELPSPLILPTDKPRLDIVLKADTLGTLETAEKLIKALPQEKVEVRIIHKEPGPPTVEDIELVESFKGKLVCFRVKPDKKTQALLDQKGMKIIYSDVIYDLIEKIRNALVEMLEPEKKRIEKGTLEVLVVFKSEGSRQIIGCKVLEGEVKKGDRLEAYRKGELRAKGKAVNLQIEKRDVEVAHKGEEVGILWEGNRKVGEGDIIKVVEEQITAPSL